MLTHCHTIGGANDLLSRIRGALAFIFVWGLGEFVGPLSPLVIIISAVFLPFYVTGALAIAMGYSFAVSAKSLYSPEFCRFFLWQANWIKGGASLWLSSEVFKIADQVNDGVMVCYHPHGLIPCGFCLNGAIRGRAQQPDALPSWLPLNARCSGVQAPILFKIPILRHILLATGCCVPATKAGIHTLMSSRTTFVSSYNRLLPYYCCLSTYPTTALFLHVPYYSSRSLCSQFLSPYPTAPLLLHPYLFHVTRSPSQLISTRTLCG